MIKIKVKLLTCVIVFMVILSSLFLFSCGKTDDSPIYSIFLQAHAAGYEGTYEEWLETIKGEKGDQGPEGVGITGISLTSSDGNVDTYTVTLSNGETNTFQITNGAQGPQGEQGLSAFEIAASEGFDGSQAEWLESLVGEKGPSGTSITKVCFDSENNLIVTLSDGTEMNLGPITITEHKHEYESVIEDAKCTEDGSAVFSCRVCGHVEISSIPKYGHQWGPWKEIKTATCSQPGMKQHVCVRCGLIEKEETPTHDHVASESVLFDASGHWHYCVSCGIKIDEADHALVNDACSICGFKFISNEGSNGLVFALREDGESYVLIDAGSFNGSNLVIPESYQGKPVKEIISYCFDGNASLVTAVLPDSIEKIGAYAFRECSNLESVVLPDSLETIEHYCFGRCTKLSQIVWPTNLKSIETFGFTSCGFTELVLPNGLIRINNAFQGCSKLRTVVFPETIEEIGSLSFYYDPITTIIIPASVKTIGGGAFEGIPLETAYFENPVGWQYGNGQSGPVYQEILQDAHLAAKLLVGGPSIYRE